MTINQRRDFRGNSCANTFLNNLNNLYWLELENFSNSSIRTHKIDKHAANFNREQQRQCISIPSNLVLRQEPDRK